MEEYKYKIVFLGESGTGAKTSLIDRLINNYFTQNIISTSNINYIGIFIQINLELLNCYYGNFRTRKI